ncbi:MAG: hypothetical protein O2955_03295 [Planctomycetota bacterium]|nr:hypothetical protein [Planctomycetota bacterium]MDA1211514.1 hypothetical protein [Planctomycetota bacterium]
MKIISTFLLLALATSAILAEEGIITTVAGTGHNENNGHEGTADKINIGQPFGVEIGPEGDLFITEVANHRIWQLDRKTSELAVVAGTGEIGYTGDGGDPFEAKMNEPYEVRFDGDGNLFVVEMQNHIVRRIDRKTGVITTIAGTGEAGFSGDDGPATEAHLRVPHGITLDGAGGLYIADIGNHRIRRVDLETGIITTIAGTGENKLPQEGNQAKGHPLPGPRAIAATKDSLYVVLREGHSVWRIEFNSGMLHHIAGTGKSGYSGDGGPAIEATFNGPKGIAVDKAKNIYVVDSENDAIRLIDAKTKTIRTIAGIGRSHDFCGDDGPAVKACFAQPHGICVDAEGTVYIGDTLNHRVRAFRPGDNNKNN